MDIQNDPEDPMFYTIKGKEYCREEQCLAQLLMDEVLFCNEREVVEHEFKVVDGKMYHDETKPIRVGESTTVLFVLCNDLFYWATADGEPLPNSEIGNLYKLHMANKRYGSIKWCCLRRNLRPQVPIVARMKEAGYWDAELEALPAPEPS